MPLCSERFIGFFSGFFEMSRRPINRFVYELTIPYVCTARMHYEIRLQGIQDATSGGLWMLAVETI